MFYNQIFPSFCKMEELINFEKNLYRGESIDFFELLDDYVFCVDRIVRLPNLRPFHIDKVVKICKEYCKNADFRQLLLEESMKRCYVLVNRLYENGVFQYETIQQYLSAQNTYVLYFYFREEMMSSIILNDQLKPEEFDDSFILNNELIESSIRFGFPPHTIEYCLKYDDLFILAGLLPNNQNEAKWSPFEWSRRPEHLDFLSFSGFFGSTKCFKYLLMNGFGITESVQSLVICSGNLEIIHLCSFDTSDYYEQLCYASEFCYESIARYLLENGGDVNTARICGISPLHKAATEGHISIVNFLIKQGANVNTGDMNVFLFWTSKHPFIVLHQMVICTLCVF